MRRAVEPPGAAKPSAPYSPAIVEEGFIFVSGQGPLDPKTGEYRKGDIRAETRQVFENLKAILAAAGSSLDRVVKCNVYLRDINDFAAMNEIYSGYFTAPYPA
ncbi:MAG TPA: Rid family detoxifying hydrolase, partial [Planctomycetota bacterium]|nr:Rid family detoxifying hydrolase [Planctomycetota bacterium]